MTPRAVFLLNLIQDVNILRPLIFMARQTFGYEPVLLVSSQFLGRDRLGIWQNEIDEICAANQAQHHIYSGDYEAYEHLVGGGVIFAGSESHLSAHSTTHKLFRAAPPSFLRVTVQHGYECVGFRHSADHTIAHGSTATFAADLVCAWYDLEHMTALDPSQSGKVIVTGPPALLQRYEQEPARLEGKPGIVCENLHSVRLRMAGDFQLEFVDAFSSFSGRLAMSGEQVALRPHPGGQYMLKHKVPMPANAIVNIAPMYRLDLRRYAYGISAPSSVLFDMVLAGIPTAVWTDREGAMDASTYSGLATVSSPDDWYEFSRAAIEDPAPFLARQQLFLERSGMPLDPAVVFARFAQIFASANRVLKANPYSGRETARILFVANGNVPTLQLSFEKPLASKVATGEIVTRLITEPEIRAALEGEGDASALSELLSDFDPTLIVFCRYSGPGAPQMLEWSRTERLPVMFHIDDDLLAIPQEIGERKFALHNSPERLETIRDLLDSADLVYVSTEALQARLAEYGPKAPLRAGRIYCSGQVIRRPSPGPATKVGYMASADHAHNLAMILPAIETLLDRHLQVTFELFGSIPRPPQLARFGERVSTAPPIANYENFLEEFSHFGWDIGLCPLNPIPFNLMKANTKWVEYSCVGAAVVASRGGVYDSCCADGAGLLAESVDEWLEALERLVLDDDARIAQVERAQQKLRTEYNLAQLRDQVFEMLCDCQQRAVFRVGSGSQREIVERNA
jgi:hypothetical protein